jgi:hypothetical protein
MGFLKTAKVRSNIRGWATMQLGGPQAQADALFNWGFNEGFKSPENARKLGRLVAIASFCAGGSRWVEGFRFWEERRTPELVQAFREGKAQGMAEAALKIAEFGG